MKLTPIGRRNFVGSLLTLLAIISCKKIPFKDYAVKTTFPDPVKIDPNYDLGTYTVTELGDQLFDNNFDLSTHFFGYTDKQSYLPGDAVSLYLSSPQSGNQTINLFDVNGKSVLSFGAMVNSQKIMGKKPWVDGFNLEKTTTIQLPDDMQSGFYRLPGGIPIICKNYDTAPDMTIVFPSNTYNAYANFDGKSLYRPDDQGTYRATVVSNLRYNPAMVGNFNDCFFQWMTNQKYKAKYIADIDLDNYAEIQNSKMVIITGHSEYWTRKARVNIDKFIASGKNVLILSGNTMWWQVRYNMVKNLMICYKSNSLDPLGNTTYSTINWTDKRLGYPVNTSIGADFVNGGYPDRVANPINGFKIANDRSPLLAGTGLKNGDTLSLPTLETDGAPVKKMILPGSDEIPEIDNSQMNFFKIELIAYTFAINQDGNPGLGTFVVCQKTPDSGTVVNVASLDWCSPKGMGGIDKAKLETITKNMIDGTLNKSTLFSK